MASSLKIRKFESLNMFIHERLTTVAVEIFEVFKDALAEFQEEIYRSKQENDFLKSKLAEVSFSRADAQISQDEFPPEDQNSDQDPLESSETQVKRELAAGQDPVEQQELCTPSASNSIQAAATQVLPRELSGKPDDREETEDVGVYVDPYVAVKLEQYDRQLTASDELDLSPEENGSSASYAGAIKDESGMPPSSEFPQTSGDPCCSPSFLDKSLMGLPFPCHECGKSFQNGVLLKTHMLMHQNENAFSCEFCGKCFNADHLLQNHVRTHTEEKPYHCRFCDKTFRRKANVQDHEKIHTGERPYSCSRCGKRFIWLNQVKLHIQHHHPEYATTIIKKSTKHGVLKIAHEIVRDGESKNVICELCGKSYANQHVLRKHYVVHTGERPFQCQFCNKTFTQNSHMKEHERIHTGEEKYSCSECGMGFIWLRQAKVHVQQHGQHATVERK